MTMIQGMKCVACIVERKVAEMQQAGRESSTVVLPIVRQAVAILNAQTTCAEHIVVQQQSQLAAPNGAPLLIPGGH
jgi:hypothetical protein